MMIPRHLRTVLVAAALAVPALPAHAQLTIDMTKPNFEPVPIAIVDFAGRRDGRARWRPSSATTCRTRACSARSRPAPSSSATSTPIAAPRFQDWRNVGATGLVVGQVSQCRRQPQGRLPPVGRRGGARRRPDFRFTSQPNNWRRLCHIIADAIYKRVTGEEGYFDTRVAYVAETGPLNTRIKRIAIMDQDGANNRYITDGRTLALTPRFSPTLQEIVYMAYGEANGPPRGLPAERRLQPPRAAGQFPGHELRTALLARRHQGRDELVAGRSTPTSTRWTCAATACAG